MPSTITRRAAFVVAVATASTVLVLTASPSWADRTTSNRKDGGKSVTTTTSVGTECSVFSKSGALLCTRSFNITNHAAAVARCVALKC